MAQALRSIYQLKITLEDVHPPVWRRLRVTDTITLPKLHNVLQIVMGWEDSHLHQYQTGDVSYCIPDPDFPDPPGTRDERRVKLRTLLPGPGAFLIYEYDFGDSWRHRVEVEQALPFDPAAKLPVCLDGARACPPEDVGGPPGYEAFLQAYLDRSHPDHHAMQDWMGAGFQPERFNLRQVNTRLKRLKR